MFFIVVGFHVAENIIQSELVHPQIKSLKEDGGLGEGENFSKFSPSPSFA